MPIFFSREPQYTVVFTDLAGQVLGHDEQGDAAGAFRRIGQAGQHDVDNVLGQVVLTGEMKILVPEIL